MKKIGLDAGHGLKTAGKQTPDGIKEWTLNDKVRDKVASLLADYECEIIHTDNNEGNVDEALKDRHNMYVKANVDVFVSIHHNAFQSKWGNHTGVEVYTDVNPTAKDKQLAECISSRLAKNTGLKDRGIKQCNFVVINQDRIPAVLVEGGFMDSNIDYKVITSDAGQTAYAKAVADGLIEFLNLKKKAVTTKPAVNSSIKVGDLVSIKSGAKYYTGGSVPAWVVSQKWYVSEVKGDRAVINKNEKGTSAINSPINVLYLTIAKASAAPAKPTVNYLKKYTGKSTSLVDALKAIGVTSTFAYRSKIAKANGIKAYIGTASQNTKILTLLKNGKCIKP